MLRRPPPSTHVLSERWDMLAGLQSDPDASSTAVIPLARRLAHVAYCEQGMCFCLLLFSKDLNCPCVCVSVCGHVMFQDNRQISLKRHQRQPH